MFNASTPVILARFAAPWLSASRVDDFLRQLSGLIKIDAILRLEIRWLLDNYRFAAFALVPRRSHHQPRHD